MTTTTPYHWTRRHGHRPSAAHRSAPPVRRRDGRRGDQRPATSGRVAAGHGAGMRRLVPCPPEHRTSPAPAARSRHDLVVPPSTGRGVSLGLPLLTGVAAAGWSPWGAPARGRLGRGTLQLGGHRPADRPASRAVPPGRAGVRRRACSPASCCWQTYVWLVGAVGPSLDAVRGHLQGTVASPGAVDRERPGAHRRVHAARPRPGPASSTAPQGTARADLSDDHHRRAARDVGHRAHAGRLDAAREVTDPRAQQPCLHDGVAGRRSVLTPFVLAARASPPVMSAAGRALVPVSARRRAPSGGTTRPGGWRGSAWSSWPPSCWLVAVAAFIACSGGSWVVGVETPKWAGIRQFAATSVSR